MVILVTPTTISFKWDPLQNVPQIAPIIVYQYMIRTSVQAIIGMVSANTTFHTARIMAKNGKLCKLRIAAVNVAGVGIYSPEQSVLVSHSSVNGYEKLPMELDHKEKQQKLNEMNPSSKCT